MHANRAVGKARSFCCALGVVCHRVDSLRRALCNCRGRHFKDVHEAQGRTLVLSLEAAPAGTGTKSVG